MKRYSVLCILVLALVLTACAKDKIEIPGMEPSVTTEPTEAVTITPTVTLAAKPENAEVKEIKITPTNTLAPTLTNTPTPTSTPKPTPTPEIVEGIHCKVEGDTVTFYGSGILTESLANELMKEVNCEEVCNLVIEGITEIESQLWFLRPNYTEWIETLKIEGVKNIGVYAFAPCQNLKELILAEGVECIESGAFSMCTQLEQVEFADSIEKIAWDAFGNTPWLNELKMQEKPLVINGVLLDMCGSTDIDGISEKITYTTKKAFSEEWLEEQRKHSNLIIINDVLIDGYSAEGNVIVPEGVKYIAEGAFSECEKITGVQLPDGLEAIENSAFGKCSGLTEISIPETVEYIGRDAFWGCTNLVEVVIPDNVTIIGESVFSGCTNLVTVKLPMGIEYIPDSMFMKCVSLQSIKIPESVINIGVFAFNECENLTHIGFSESLKSIQYGAFEQCKNLQQVELPETLETLERWAFGGCTNLEQIVFPEGLTYIGDNVLTGTLWMKNQLAENELVIINGVLMRAEAKQLEQHLVIPDTVEVIDAYAFEKSQFVSITIPESVKEIRQDAFRDCDALQEVELLAGLTEIPSQMFYSCDNLYSIILPEGIENIRTKAFSSEILSYIYIPDSVTMIAEDAFEKCKEWVKIYCNEKSYAKQYAEEQGIDYVEISDRFLENVPGELQKRVENGDGTIELEGEIYNVKWGENGAFISRHVEATFDSEECYRCGFIVDELDTALENWFVPIDGYFCSRWIDLREFDTCTAEHIGEDIFYLTLSGIYGYKDYYYNPSLRYVFTNKNVLDDKEDLLVRHTDFNDGYALCSYLDIYYTEWAGYKVKNEQRWIAFLDKRGNMIKTDIELGDWYLISYDRPGIYSDGVFYHDDAFYTIDSEFTCTKILDLSGGDYGGIYVKEGIYAPYFENGVCTLITEKMVSSGFSILINLETY